MTRTGRLAGTLDPKATPQETCATDRPQGGAAPLPDAGRTEPNGTCLVQAADCGHTILVVRTTTCHRLLHTLLVTTSLSAVGGCIGCRDQDAGPPTKLIIADTGTTEVNKATWDRAIELFKQRHPGMDAERQVLKDDDYTTYGLPSLMRSRRPPDIYFAWAGYSIRRDVGEGVALDLTSALSGDWLATFDPRAFTGSTLEGRYYMVPDSIALSNVIWYWRSILRRHGIEPPRTWQEFADACRRLSAAGVCPIVHGNQAGWPAGNWAAHLVEQYAGAETYQAAGVHGSIVHLNCQPFVRALLLLEDLAAMGTFNRDMNTINDAEGVARFSAKGGAFHFNGQWLLQDIEDQNDIGFIGVLPLPDLPAEPYSVLATASGYLIHAHSPRHDMAIELLKAYMLPETQRIAVAGGVFSGTRDTNVGQERSPLMAHAVEVLAGADHFVPAPDISWHPRIADRFYHAVRQVVGGSATAQAALDAAAADVAGYR
ncbi:MAG TPA: extracellular solute-binding protein [Phycisphaerae bacterium]|nr:extracellular solute-binding protein [Phycisphaerae bacterium]HRY69622.1 extracellular solute-binding protein [Phycisphaerae bacterium]